MQSKLVKADERGHAEHGWLNTWHSFSFANFYDPSKVHFGALRVLNDDEIGAGMGFGMRPHDNLEIITLVQTGELRHSDSMGHTSVIKPGEVQVMSAGTGIFHSEHNNLKDEKLHLFQIWVIPQVRNVKPRYDQRVFEAEDRKNKLQVIVSPEGSNEGIWIYQNAWFSLADLEAGNDLAYASKRKGNGTYLFVIEGSVEAADKTLQGRDALELTDFDTCNIYAATNARLLLMDVPMEME